MRASALVVATCFSMICSLYVTAPLPAQTLLRWKLQAGEKIDVAFKQQMKMEATLAGQQVLSEADLGIDLRWNVQSVSPEGESQVLQSIRRVQLAMSSPGYDRVEYDSGASETPTAIAQTIGKAVQPLLGLDFVQKMDALGQIDEIKLADESAAAAAGAAAQELNQTFSQEGLRDLLTQAAATLPHQAVNVGDQWKGRAEVGSPVGKLLMDITYTYKGREQHEGRSLDRIDVAVQMHFDEGPNAMQMQVSIAENDCSGVVYFDNEQGRLVSSEIHRHVVTETRIGDQTHRHVVDTDLQLALTAAEPRVANPSVEPRF